MACKMRFDNRMDESLKLRILKAIGDDSVMPTVLSGLMERTKAEFCAFVTMRETELVYIMAESRDLSPHVPEIREKLKNTYRMFTNGRSHPGRRRSRRSFSGETGSMGPTGGAARESRATFSFRSRYGPQVRGVLFVGSVRKEAFGRRDIALFHSLADERDEKTPIVFRVDGEKEILDRFLDALPSGAALFSPDGRIASANGIFRKLMNMDGDLSESVYDVGRLPASISTASGKSSTFFRAPLSIESSRVRAFPRDISRCRGCASIPFPRRSARSRLSGKSRRSESRRKRGKRKSRSSRTSCARLCRLSRPRSRSCRPRATRGTGARALAGPDRTFSRAPPRRSTGSGRLVDGLVESSAARLDERPLKIESHDVRKFLDEITMLFVHPMEIRGIDFSIDVDEACRNLMFDRDRIEQVIQNLLANSMKHVPAGGSISISIRACAGCPARILPVELAKLLPSIAFADLLLRDSGSGIPREVAELSNTTESAERPVKASQGLGLVIAKRLVRMQGGSLLIDESIEKGSAVHLFLPVDQETARIVKRYRALQMKVDEMTGKGLASAIFVISKETSISWDEVAEQCRPLPVINPEAKEMGGRDAFLWSLSEGVALALVTRIDRIEDPAAFLGEPDAGPETGSRMIASTAVGDCGKCVDVAAPPGPAGPSA